MYVVSWRGNTALVDDAGEPRNVDAPPAEAAALRKALREPAIVRGASTVGDVITEVVDVIEPGRPGHVEAVLRALPGAVVTGP